MSRTAREDLSKYGCKTVLKHLPPYAPEPSPVEARWRGIKEWTANTLYRGTD